MRDKRWVLLFLDRFFFFFGWCIINKYEWSFEFGVMSRFFYFDGFEFVFWESNRGEGEMRRENGGEWVPRVGLTKRSDHFTGMGPTKKWKN